MSTTRFAHRARGILTTTTAVVAAALLPALVGGAEAQAAGPSERAVAGMPMLARGAGYADAAGSPQVRRLQRWLRRAGARPGPVDGLFGPLTEGAVVRFQRARGLRQDGIAGPITLRHLLRPRRASRAEARRAVREAAPSTASTAPRPAVTSDARPAPAAPARTASRGSDGAPVALIAAVAILVADLALLLRIVALRRRDARRRRATASPAGGAGELPLPTGDHDAPGADGRLGTPAPAVARTGDAWGVLAPDADAQSEPSPPERIAVMVIDARAPSALDELEEGGDPPPEHDPARDGAPPPSRHRSPGFRVVGRTFRRAEAERVRSHVRRD